MDDQKVDLIAGLNGDVGFFHGLGARPVSVVTTAEGDHAIVTPANDEHGKETVEHVLAEYAFGVEGFDDERVWGRIWHRENGVPAEHGTPLTITWKAVLA